MKVFISDETFTVKHSKNIGFEFYNADIEDFKDTVDEIIKVDGKFYKVRTFSTCFVDDKGTRKAVYITTEPIDFRYIRTTDYQVNAALSADMSLEDIIIELVMTKNELYDELVNIRRSSAGRLSLTKWFS